MRMLVCAVVLGACADATGIAREQCANGADDDGDALVDCADDDCFGSMACFASCATPCAGDQICQQGQCTAMGGVGGGSATGGGAAASGGGAAAAGGGGSAAAGGGGAAAAGGGSAAAGGGGAAASGGGAAATGGGSAAGGGSASGTAHVHIYIDNFCNTSVSPTSLNVPLSSGVMLQIHNHSVDYEADAWSSRGYGYLEMPMGFVWNDPIMHCRGPMPYSEYFDISIAGGGGSACPGVRFTMNCQ